MVLSEEVIADIAAQVGEDPQERRLSIDLEECSVLGPDGQKHHFNIESLSREMLIGGLDAIDMTLELRAAIDAFLISDRKKRSWSYLG